MKPLVALAQIVGAVFALQGCVAIVAVEAAQTAASDASARRQCEVDGGLNVLGALPESGETLVVAGHILRDNYRGRRMSEGMERRDIPDPARTLLPRKDALGYASGFRQNLVSDYIRNALAGGRFDSVVIRHRVLYRHRPGAAQFLLSPAEGAPTGYYRYRLLQSDDPACQAAQWRRTGSDDNPPGLYGAVRAGECFTRDYLGPTTEASRTGYLLVQASSLNLQGGARLEVERLYAPGGSPAAEFRAYRSPRYGAGLDGVNPDFVCPSEDGLSAPYSRLILAMNAL